MEPEIIFEDEFLMVINKPAGWITNSANTTTTQPVVQEWIAKNFTFPIFKFPECRNGIVHRLDKETYGVLLIAKTREVFEKLQLEFKNREVQKTYIALVHGEMDPTSGKIEISVGRLPWRRDRFGVLPGGRDSVTFYRTLAFYNKEKDKFSLVELSPKTGRTHQIRIHMKFLTHPIVSDDFYAGRKTSRRDRKWCPRLFLHAASISFIHPVNSTKVNFEAKLPTDLNSSLELLEKIDGNP